MKKIKVNFRSKKFIIAVIIAALLISGSAFAYVATRDDDKKNEDVTANGPESESIGTSYDINPATEEEKRESEQHKDAIVEQQNQPAPQPGQKKQVSVVITSADANSINAYVSGVLEDGGTCTATLTKGSQKIDRTSSGFSNVSTTNCSPIAPNFPSGGTWTVTVSYSSASAEGKAQTTVEVP